MSRKKLSDEISPAIIEVLKDASSKLKGSDKRAFMANITNKFCKGSPRVAERSFSWCRYAVSLGINEVRTGIICLSDLSQHGRQQREIKNPKLEIDIRSLVDSESQADPKLKNAFLYTRITAKGVRNKPPRLLFT